MNDEYYMSIALKEAQKAFQKNEVPVGAVGELYLSGYQAANGYLNREKETKEAFLDNPFVDKLILGSMVSNI